MRLMNQNNNLREPNHFRGLSTETKPTENVRNGDEYLEIDTKKLYFYDLENHTWLLWNEDA